METNEINYKNLRRIQQLEKTSPLFTKIDLNFYYKLSYYLKNLESVAKQEKDYKKIKLFNDEIQNTKKLAFKIYEQREKKIVQAALSKIRGGKPDLKNVLEVEKNLYDSLVEQIILSRKKILEEKPAKLKKDELKGETLRNEENKGNTNPIVRVLEDIPEFVGTDMRTYSLRKNDVLTISKEMSESLVKRGVVKQIK
jgi:DNA replication initiation complex subunit (GINS family)